MTIGAVGLVELAYCVDILAFGPTYSCYGIDIGYAAQILGLLVNGGALSSLPVAVGVSALASRVRHPRST
jgi:hypothetical protein